MILPATEFHVHKNTKDRLNIYCRSCSSIRMREWRRLNKTKAERAEADRHLRRTYGVSIDDYESMEVSQSGLCALCETPRGKRRLSVDHHHVTGKVRGLLCANCNHAMWLVDLHEDWRERIEAYL